MKLVVSSKNEFNFIPDIANNKDIADKDKFIVVMRKVNRSLDSDKWTTFDKEGSFDISYRDKLKAYIVKFVNPPILSIDGVEEKELTVDMLLNSSYPELDILIDQLVDKMNDLDLGIDIKKS
jgi:hypothetical protein